MAKYIESINENGESELLVAIKNDDVKEAKRLIDLGANVNVQDQQLDSPYLYAGAEGKTEILAYMLEHADIDYTIFNRFGGNALIPASEKGHLENVKLILAAQKEDVDHQNNFGYTALIEAIALTDGSKVYQDIVRELLNAKANSGLVDKYRKTALDYAKEKNYYDMIEVLLSVRTGYVNF